MQPGYLVEALLSIRKVIQENNLKKLLVVISLSRSMTVWATGLKGEREVGRELQSEQHCKWDANLWNAGSLFLILKQIVERSIDKEETVGLIQCQLQIIYKLSIIQITSPLMKSI